MPLFVCHRYATVCMSQVCHCMYVTGMPLPQVCHCMYVTGMPLYVCHRYATVCMSQVCHCVYVTGMPLYVCHRYATATDMPLYVCHRYATVCMSQVCHCMYATGMPLCVCHRYATVCMSQVWHKHSLNPGLHPPHTVSSSCHWWCCLCHTAVGSSCCWWPLVTFCRPVYFYALGVKCTLWRPFLRFYAWGARFYAFWRQSPTLSHLRFICVISHIVCLRRRRPSDAYMKDAFWLAACYAKTQSTLS